MKWLTEIEIIDIETGEALDKKKLRKGKDEYIILKKKYVKTKTSVDEKYKTRTYRWYCRKKNQLELFGNAGTTQN